MPFAGQNVKTFKISNLIYWHDENNSINWKKFLFVEVIRGCIFTINRQPGGRGKL